jgi:hypothetical protein
MAVSNPRAEADQTLATSFALHHKRVERSPAAGRPQLSPAACRQPCAAAVIAIFRNALSPQRLVDTFPAPHDDIHTLYDNLESSVAAYGDVSGGAACVHLISSNTCAAQHNPNFLRALRSLPTVSGPKLPSACLPALQTPYLGHRTSDAKGQPGPYVWQTYSEVAELRSAIGSGMQHLGIQPGAAVGLYSSGCCSAAEFWPLCGG